VIAADRPVQRPPGAKLLVIDACGAITHASRAWLVEFLRPGDLVIANDAATLPASLQGVHEPSDGRIEVRLAGRRSLAPDDIGQFSAVVFGAGDYRARTEDRPPPPRLRPGDRLTLGPLAATVERLLGHPRLMALRFDGTPDAIWAGLARHGRPIQYAHVREPLALWDVWTPIAGPPVAFEPPSAGFALDWRALAAMRARGVAFATLTHVAGISSTGDSELDRRLPFDEPYRIPRATALAVRRARARGRRVVAVGTTVVRALEHAATGGGQVRAGEGLATQRIGPATHLRVVDVLLSGTHEPGSSHYELLRAFADDVTLGRAYDDLTAHDYRTHEFGDSVLIERCARCRPAAAGSSRLSGVGWRQLRGIPTSRLSSEE
jgi:S-adenosylmethionine:tRNA ribosyltransferase-isomerase